MYVIHPWWIIMQVDLFSHESKAGQLINNGYFNFKKLYLQNTDIDKQCNLQLDTLDGCFSL